MSEGTRNLVCIMGFCKRTHRNEEGLGMKRTELKAGIESLITGAMKTMVLVIELRRSILE